MIHACSGAGCLHVNARHIQLITWIAQGKTNADIGRLMNRAESSVKNMLVPLFDELGASNRTGLVFAAIKAGLVNLEDLDLL